MLIPRYAELTPEQLPAAESLKITLERVLPYWHWVLERIIKSGKRVLIWAHGHSIRALVKYLDNIYDTEITELNISTGVPWVYELDENLKVIKHDYLGYSEQITKAARGNCRQSGQDQLLLVLQSIHIFCQCQNAAASG